MLRSIDEGWELGLAAGAEGRLYGLKSVSLTLEAWMRIQEVAASLSPYKAKP